MKSIKTMIIGLKVLRLYNFTYYLDDSKSYRFMEDGLCVHPAAVQKIVYYIINAAGTVRLNFNANT